jgi:hypothetical protein
MKKACYVGEKLKKKKRHYFKFVSFFQATWEIYYSETSMIYQTTMHYIPEDRNFHAAYHWEDQDVEVSGQY